MTTEQVLELTDEEILAEFNQAYNNEGCLRCRNCSNCVRCEDCDKCNDCVCCSALTRCEECVGCHNCVDCYGCSRKNCVQYMIHNRQFVSTVYHAAVALIHRVN